MPEAVISTIGHDRPGLVSDITAIARDHDLNIEDSRMTVLAGQFAVLMAVEGSEDSLLAFDKAMQTLSQSEDGQLAYLFRPGSRLDKITHARIYEAEVVALDHPGIVHALAGFFSAREINIRNLNTQTQPAAHTGTPIFSVSLLAEIPADLKIHDIKSQFEAFCIEADLDGTLEPYR